LKYTGLTANNQPFGIVYSGMINVETGVMYKLIVSQFVGHAFGGVPFQNNPVIGVADKGRNIVSDISTGSVTATLSLNPTNSELLPVENTIAPIKKGIAVFTGLYIDEISLSYQISFSTTLPVSHHCYFLFFLILSFFCRIFHLWSHFLLRLLQVMFQVFDLLMEQNYQTQ
jgi:hypothetical protein